jgi:maltose O-acetyltransferase
LATEKEKCLAGLPYNPADPELRDDRIRARILFRKYNTAEYEDIKTYREILAQLLPHCADDIFIEPPFYCDYGYNIHAGHNVYFNFNCILLDTCTITIGDNVLAGPGVHIYAATHPSDATERREIWEIGKPVTIGDDCWIGGQATILPGVTIGKRCIVGSGAVVTRDIPDDTKVGGNPARKLA